jgi:hypothetical protein
MKLRTVYFLLLSVGLFCPLSFAVTTVTNVVVDSIQKQGKVWSGRISYDIQSDRSDLFVWLEFSSDGGATWGQRHVHAVGRVGGIAPGAGLRALWTVDGDKGLRCKIRVRVNDAPATYSNFDADSNKYPFPLPADPYENIERLASRTDFPNFSHATNRLPNLNFFKSISGGIVKAGFARLAHFRSTKLFMHCLYLTDGKEQYVFLNGDCVRMYNSYLHGIRHTLSAHLGIPEDNIMITWNHRHYTDGSDSLSKIVTLVQAAKSSAQPVKVAYLDHDLRRRFNYAQTYMGTSPTYGAKVGHFCTSGKLYPHLRLNWQVEAGGDTAGALVEDISPNILQHRLDAPLDSYLQGLIFKDLSDNLVGVMLKFTGHFDTGNPRAMYDTLKARFGQDVEVMYINGLGGNAALLRYETCDSWQQVQAGWTRFGPAAMARYFADLLEQKIPQMTFEPLTRVGAVMGWELFGSTYHQRDSLLALDPERQGTGVGVFRLNDIYLSTLPSEGNMEVGLYLRARTAGIKLMYTGYGNTWAGNYWSWGRWQFVNCYTCPVVYPRYDCFRMVQEVVRAVNILSYSW